MASELPLVSTIRMPQVADQNSAYEMTIQLLMYESQLAWSRFNVLLVANSIIIPAIGAFLANKQAMLSLVLSIFGVLVCLLLGIVINRGLDFHAYWEAAASELEEGVEPSLQVISRSVRFRRGETLIFTVAGQQSQIRLGWRRIRARNVANVLILMFVLVYIALIIDSVAVVTGFSISLLSIHGW